MAPVPSVPEPTPAPQPKPAAIPDDQQMAHAIQMATAAVAADNGKDYAKAFELYRSSLGHFMKGLQHEKDKAKKALIMQRMEGYMKRAEQLKAWVDKQEAAQKAQSAAASADAIWNLPAAPTGAP